jgi:hypothetical protein
MLSMTQHQHNPDLATLRVTHGVVKRLPMLVRKRRLGLRRGSTQPKIEVPKALTSPDSIGSRGFGASRSDPISTARVRRPILPRRLNEPAWPPGVILAPVLVHPVGLRRAACAGDTRAGVGPSWSNAGAVRRASNAATHPGSGPGDRHANGTFTG